jgi:hypothetical protein
MEALTKGAILVSSNLYIKHIKRLKNYQLMNINPIIMIRIALEKKITNQINLQVLLMMLAISHRWLTALVIKDNILLNQVIKHNTLSILKEYIINSNHKSIHLGDNPSATGRRQMAPIILIKNTINTFSTPKRSNHQTLVEASIAGT